MRNILKGYHEIIAIGVTLSAGTGGTAVFTPAALGPVYSLNSLPIGTQIQLVQIQGVDTYVFLHNGSEIGSLTITLGSGYDSYSVAVNSTTVTSTAITLSDGDIINVEFEEEVFTISFSNYGYGHWEDSYGSIVTNVFVSPGDYFYSYEEEGDAETGQMYGIVTLAEDSSGTNPRVFTFIPISGYTLSYIEAEIGLSITHLSTSTPPYGLSNGDGFIGNATEMPKKLYFGIKGTSGDNLASEGEWIYHGGASLSFDSNLDLWYIQYYDSDNCNGFFCTTIESGVQGGLTLVDGNYHSIVEVLYHLAHPNYSFDNVIYECANGTEITIDMTSTYGNCEPIHTTGSGVQDGDIVWLVLDDTTPPTPPAPTRPTSAQLVAIGSTPFLNSNNLRGIIEQDASISFDEYSIFNYILLGDNGYYYCSGRTTNNLLYHFELDSSGGLSNYKSPGYYYEDTVYGGSYIPDFPFGSGWNQWYCPYSSSCGCTDTGCCQAIYDYIHS